MGDDCIINAEVQCGFIKKAMFISVILFLVSVGSAGAVPVTACGPLNTAGETYVLSKDISSTSGTCFTIGADNIILDGAGYGIIGDGSGSGVYLNGRSGVTVKNLNVSGFWPGINLRDSSNNTITNNNASNNNNGISLYSSSNNNTLTNNAANSNNNYGISLRSSNNNILTGNIANSNNDDGIYLSSSSSNTLTGNTANSNNDDGIVLGTSSSNTLTGNTANSNTYGIYLHWNCNDNTITNNTANSNNYGIYLHSSSNNTITNNVIDDSVTSGFYFLATNSYYNTIKDNTINGDTYYHLVNEDGIVLENLVLTSEKPSNLGWVSVINSTNVTLRNLTLANNSGYSGLFLYKTDDSSITNVTSYSNYYGIRLYYSSSNTLTGNTMSANTYNFYIYGSSVSYYVQTIDISNTVDGRPIYYLVGVSDLVIDPSTNAGFVGIVNSVNVTVKDMTLTKNSHGVLFANATDSSILNVYVPNNYYGISLYSSGSNTIQGNTAKENNNHDVYVSPTSDADCNNVIENNTGSGDRPIKYFNYSVNLQDEVLSELILCNADNSTINNVTIKGTATKKNNALWVIRTNNSSFTNINSSNNKYGVYLSSSSSNILTGNTANSNNWYGIRLYSSSGNTLTGNNANSNNRYGISLYDSSSNILTGNNANSNNWDGIHPSSIGIRLDYSSSNTLTGNNASNNEWGIILDSSSSNILTGNTANSNNYDGIYLSRSSSNTLTGNTANLNTQDGITFRSSSNNKITNNTANLNTHNGILLWSSSSNTIYNNLFNNTNNFNLPSSTNIWNTTKTSGTNIVGGPYLGGNFWANPDGTGFSETCTDADYNGICDSSYTLGSGNVDYLPLTNGGSGGGVTQIDSCSTISSPGVYELTMDIVDSSATKCIEITSSDVVFDGAGYTIDGMGTGGTYGVYVYNSSTVLTNVTVRNLVVTDWYDGIYYRTAENGSIVNNTANWNTWHGIALTYSSGNTITGNTVSNNNRGIYLGVSDSNTITNNIANSNNYYGINLDYSSGNTITDNTASNNLGGGIRLEESSNNNTIANNTASNNYDGIDLLSSNNNTLTGNNASNNNGAGIRLSNPRSNVIYLNNFIDNSNNFYSYNSANTWNSPEQITYTYSGSTYINYLGNYWSDYSGSDTDGDGIGDSPYGIDGDSDSYPLMEGFESYLISTSNLNVVIMSPTGISMIAGSEQVVKAKVFDGENLTKNAQVDGKLSSISFKLYDDGKSTHGDDVEDDGIYSAKIIVPDVQSALLEINAKDGDKSGSASVNLDVEPPRQALKVEAEIIDDNPPTFTGDTVRVKAVVLSNGSIVNDAEVNSTITYPNSHLESITLQNKGDYYETDFDWLFQAGEFTFDVVAYPNDGNAIQGYDTKKLTVYHGYLYITQEDTGTTFKKGQPMEFKAEVTCTGLTCPGKVDNAHVTMKILPDNLEISLAGYGDGKYNTSYIFTTPGVREISFSASAPFYIPAEITGNNIEIIDEDYDLTKAVEEFASYNIETLDSTKYDAAKLYEAGDYFFSKIDEDTTDGIASLIARPLKYFTTDVLFPSGDYTEWYGKILLGRVIKKLGSERIEKLYRDYLIDKYIKFEQETQSPFFSDFRDYLDVKSNFKDDITNAKQDTLSNFAIIPEDQRSTYLEDLNKRSQANGWIKNLISNEVEFPYEVYKARQAGDLNWKKDFIVDIGIGIIGILYPPSGLALLGGAMLLDTYNTVDKLDEDARLVTITSETFSDLYVKSKKIRSNTVSGILQFKDTNPPVIPDIELLSSEDYSVVRIIESGYAGSTPAAFIKESYTLVTVKNNGSTPVNVWIVSYLPYVIDGGRKTLNPGEPETFRINYYTYDPTGGGLSVYLIFAENDNGIYLVTDAMRIFSPVLLEYNEGIDVGLDIGGYSETLAASYLANTSLEQLGNFTVMPYPIEMRVTRANMTTYDVIITAINPFPYPINAEITQNTTSWNMSISPRETKTLNYTIYPEQGVKTTIPRAYMEYFDFQHNTTLTFSSYEINFTPYGFAIRGDLPYKINDYVEINLSITNLVNITNGTFNLKLVGNETFEYNVTANIENLSTLTVKFNTSAIPEGEYIGILNFVWDDERILVDAVTMIKAENQLPIAAFSILPSTAVVNQTVLFNASSSYDPDGYIINYTWNFGDANVTNTTTPIITHSYQLTGDYNVTLTVTDDSSDTNSTSKLIQVTTTDTTPPGHVNTTVIPRMDYNFNITWTTPPDPDLKEFNIYLRLNDNSSTDTLIDTVPANYTQPYVAGPGNNSTGNLYQYMVTAVDESGNEGNGTYTPDTPVPPIPFAPLGTLLTLCGALATYGYYRRKMG